MYALDTIEAKSVIHDQKGKAEKVMAVIGIDLGTTNSLACIWRQNKAELIPNELGEYMTPSVVSLDENGSALVGKAAKQRLITHPERTISSFKRFMGTEKVFRLGDKSFRPEDLSALVLRKLKEDAENYLGEPVTEAVISVPAYFDDNKRSATKAAAMLAGLPVRRLINEPSAAAFYHRLLHDQEDARFLVIDFGGGTLDVSVVDCFENIIEIMAIAGDNQLGGDDVDMAIARYFCQENDISFDALSKQEQRTLLRRAEKAKCNLSEEPESLITFTCQSQAEKLTVTRPVLRKLCDPLLERLKKVILRAIRDSRITAESLTDVILVGGSSRLPALSDFLEELMGQRPSAIEHPEYLVALGAGGCAGVITRESELSDLVMTDVSPFSLGVATYNSLQDSNPHMATLIPRSSLLPASHTDTFYTLRDGQAALRLEIYQGEAYYVSENIKLGEITVHVPPGPAGSQSVNLRFTYDINGILQVEAQGSGGDRKSISILNKRLRQSPEETEHRSRELAQIKLNAEGTPEDRLLLEWAKRLFTECTGNRRETAAQIIRLLSQAIDNGRPIELEKTRRWALGSLTFLEAAQDYDPWGNQPDYNETVYDKEEDSPETLPD